MDVTSAISAMISLFFAIITSFVALYLIRTRPRYEPKSHNDDILQQIEDESAEAWNSWSSDQFLEFLSGFLLPDELDVVKAMANFIIQDSDGPDFTDKDDNGWRNKHQIITATGVPQRIIYNRNGMVERLLKLDMIQIRDSKSGWGKQKHQYRLNPNNEFMGAFLAAINESLT